MKKTIIYLLLFVILASFLTSCSIIDNFKRKDETLAGETAVNGINNQKFINEGQIAIPLMDMTTLNPILSSSSSYYYFSKLMYESLFELDEDLSVKPLLVDTYTIENEGKSVRVSLKDNVYWHNGEKLTSDDIVFTVNAIKKAGLDSKYYSIFETLIGSFSPSEIRKIIDITAIDSKNLNIYFDRPFSNNLEVLTFPILPQSAYGGLNKQGYKKVLESDNFIPVGTGPYKFSSKERNYDILLEVNDEYWNGTANIKKIIGKNFKNNEDIITAFETRQINIANTNLTNIDKYKKDASSRVIDYISSNYEFIGCNFKNKLFSSEDGLKIRQAIELAIDKKSIIQKVYLGRAKEVLYPVHPESWLFQDEDGIGYSLSEAKSIVNNLGYNFNEEDKVLENSEGDQLKFRLLTNTNNVYRWTIADMIKSDLEKLGFQVDIIPEPKKGNLSAEDMAEQWEEIMEIVKNGDYDLFLSGWNLSPIVDLSFAFHSSQINDGSNFINYSDEKMDELLEIAFHDGNRKHKEANYSKIQKHIADEIPYISLLFKKSALLVDHRILGELHPTIYNPYKGLEKCFLQNE